jgi:hypothetical protein
MLRSAPSLRRADDDFVARTVFINADLSPAEAKLAFEDRQRKREKKSAWSGRHGACSVGDVVSNPSAWPVPGCTGDDGRGLRAVVPVLVGGSGGTLSSSQPPTDVLNTVAPSVEPMPQRTGLASSSQVITSAPTTNSVSTASDSTPEPTPFRLITS